MIPYILLIFIPAIFCFVAVRKNEKAKRIICFGSSESIQSNSFAIPIFFILFLIMLSLRDETIGRDLANYSHIFDVCRKADIRELSSYNMEWLYKLLNWGIGQITESYQVLIAIIAILTVIPVMWIYQEDRHYNYLKIILFVNLSTFIMYFSGLRQVLAMAVGMIAYAFVRKKKFIPFLLTTLIAIGLHHSAFIILPMYPLYHVTLKKSHLLFVVPAIVAVFIFNREVFGLLSNFMSIFSNDYVDVTTTTGAYGSLFLFIIFAVFSYILPDETKMNKELYGLRNFMLFSVVLQCFAPIHYLVMRLNYYYILFIPILLPKIINAAKSEYKQLAKLSVIVLCVFFTFVFIITTYNSYVTGISTLDTIPYIPFWK